MKKFVLLMGMLVVAINILSGLIFWKPEEINTLRRCLAIFFPLGVVVVLTLLKILIYDILLDKKNNPNSVIISLSIASVFFLTIALSSIEITEISGTYMAISSVATGIIISYIYVTWREKNWYKV